jgi:hypothetical protein
LTLGGTLDLSAPPAIGGTTPAAVTGTTITANTKFVSPHFDAANSAGGQLRNASGTPQLQWGGGGGSNLTVDVAMNINPANAAVSIAPTGTGTVTINPATAGTMNRVAIGGTTPAAGTFTTLADAAGSVRQIPQSGSAKTSSYTLTTDDVGEFIQVGSGGSVTIPDATFAAGDAVSVFNNTTGNITITCTITTAYIGGTDSDKATVTLATRGVATILFISGTVCVISGNVT